MRSAILATAAFAATALALPQQQLAFSPPQPATVVREALTNPLRDAWKAVKDSQPVGWVAEGVRKFSREVVADGVDCASSLLSPFVLCRRWGRAHGLQPSLAFLS